ncbi:MAG: hypothetical protein JWN63_937 [Candidatus Acidoferrum typicum]|nr:hypothetical protein [Candidatus Acidoferrum typicum]
MANEPQSAESPSLSGTVERCLTSLQSLSLALDTYGNEDHAAMLHEVISQLQKAVPAQPASVPDSMDFVVNATFKVSRRQVANALSCAFGSQITRFRVVELIEPPAFQFRSIEHLTHRLVDYPLNEGGSIGIVSTEPSSDVFRLDLNSIGRGLDDLATKYPRHFADLVNENTDAITADVLLQCCLFGELIYE